MKKVCKSHNFLHILCVLVGSPARLHRLSFLNYWTRLTEMDYLSLQDSVRQNGASVHSSMQLV